MVIFHSYVSLPEGIFPFTAETETTIKCPTYVSTQPKNSDVERFSTWVKVTNGAPFWTHLSWNDILSAPSPFMICLYFIRLKTEFAV